MSKLLDLHKNDSDEDFNKIYDWGYKNWTDNERAEWDAEKQRRESAKAKETTMNEIEAAPEKAEQETTEAALALSRTPQNEFSSVGRAQSAAYASTGGSYDAATFYADNIQQNKQTAFNNAIEAGQQRLTAAGAQNEALNLAEAQRLLNQSEKQQKYADAMTLMAGFLR